VTGAPPGHWRVRYKGNYGVEDVSFGDKVVYICGQPFDRFMSTDPKNIVTEQDLAFSMTQDPTGGRSAE